MQSIIDPSQWHPHCLDVEVTTACDLGCAYCYLGKPGEGQMDEATADATVAYLASHRRHWTRHQVAELNLYGGEPFLNFPIMQRLVAKAREALPVRVAVFTNGATATADQVRWCVRNGVHPKRSTAGFPEAAALTRPGGYTGRWLDEGVLWHDEWSTHRLTVTPETAPYVAHSVRWLHIKGYHGPVDLATDDYAAWSEDDLRAYYDCIWKLAREFIHQYARDAMLAVENFTNAGRCLFGQGDAMVLGCGAGWNTQGIDYSGGIVPCHRFFREPAGSEFRGGSVLDPNLAATFDWAFLTRLRVLSAGIETDTCHECDARRCCSHGCYHVSHVACGDLSKSPDIRCRVTRLYAEVVRWIHRQVGDGNPWWKRSPSRCYPFTEE